MIIELNLDDCIFDKLEENSKERGITIEELIRWVVGDYIKYNNPPTYIRPVSSLPALSTPAKEQEQKFYKLTELIIKALVNQGIYKCPSCTLPLTMEAIEENKCQNCGETI